MFSVAQIVYEKNEEFNSIYFVSAGELAVVIPSNSSIDRNCIVYKTKRGHMIGFEDYAFYLHS